MRASFCPGGSLRGRTIYLLFLGMLRVLTLHHDGASPLGSSPQSTVSDSVQHSNRMEANLPLTASLLPRDCCLLDSNSVPQNLKGLPHYSKKLLIALSGLSKSQVFYTSTFMRTHKSNCGRI